MNALNLSLSFYFMYEIKHVNTRSEHIWTLVKNDKHWRCVTCTQLSSLGRACYSRCGGSLCNICADGGEGCVRCRDEDREGP